MKNELDKYFKEANETIKDRAILEGVVNGMKAIVIEATGDCPCGDPDCNGCCGYGLESKPEAVTEATAEPVSENTKENSPLQVLEEARGDTPKASFVAMLAEAIDHIEQAPLRTRLKQKLEKYAKL